jgi:cytochrome c peroxidase
MKTRLLKRSLPFMAVALGLLAVQVLPPTGWNRTDPTPESVVGDPEQVRRAYKEWAQAHEQAGGDRQVVIALGWSKALSRVRSRATGTARLNLVDGRLAVDVSGLDGAAADVWLVDNQEVPGDSVAPEPHDRYLRLGALSRAPGRTGLDVDLGPRAFRDFDVDLVVVTRAHATPAEGGMLFGSPTLFQRAYHRERRLSAGLTEAPTPVLGRSLPGALFATLDPVAQAAGESLVERGNSLFTKETFGGNGRSCATCHPAANNFTIDPTFIASLPANNPLFVAERKPELAALENPRLMRRVGLILENVDGFDQPGVMRSVPHTFALRTSLTPATFDRSTLPPNQRTGWSGDGSPGGGTLREFAIGAVTQHFPRTLARVNGTDFRLPSDAELDAMEAFQLSLGRQADLNLASLNFKNPVVQLGKRIFTNGGPNPDTSIAQGQCFQCHNNAGAGGSSGANANFDTGVEELPAQPADLVDPANNPPDGGFGRDPHPGGGFGNGRFNTPPLVEAADTGPFFHNNAIETIEEAVNFYNSDAFNASPSGSGPPVGNVKLAATEVVAVAAFLRVINAAENLRQSSAESNRALNRPFAAARAHLEQSLEELKDALEVLRAGKLHPAAVNQIVAALALEAAASAQPLDLVRNTLIQQANQKKAAARSDMMR